MRLPSISCVPTAVAANGICLSQNPSAAGDLLINGSLASAGTVTLGAAQLVRLTSASDDQAFTFTFYGTDADGRNISQAVAGTSSSNSDTTLYFKTITRITTSGNCGAVIVGNLIASVSPTIRPSHRKQQFNIGFGVILNSGTVTYAVQHSYDDYEGGEKTQQTYPTTWFTHGTATGKNASFDAAYTSPVSAIRLSVSASSSANIIGKFIEAGA